MRQLYTLAFPELNASDAAFIEEFRRRHDPNAELVAAHFTLVFGASTVREAAYLTHVARVASNWEPIQFVCQHAITGDDEHGDPVHVFLVPDEGLGAMSLLHDRLYTGPLASQLRSDVSYLPHITLGTIDDPAAAKSVCENLNRECPRIEGKLRDLTVVASDGKRLRSLARYRLGGAG